MYHQLEGCTRDPPPGDYIDITGGDVQRAASGAMVSRSAGATVPAEFLNPIDGARVAPLESGCVWVRSNGAGSIQGTPQQRDTEKHQELCAKDPGAQAV